MKNTPLTLNIEDDQLVIKIGLETLAEAIKANNYFSNIIEENDDENAVSIPDLKLFGKNIIRALEEDDEVGTTLVYEMFDQAAINMCENGEEGILINGE